MGPPIILSQPRFALCHKDSPTTDRERKPGHRQPPMYKPAMNVSDPESAPQPVNLTEVGQQVSAALIHVTDELDIELASVTIVKVEHKLWPDASLGISEPGVAYVQALTPGCVIQMQAGDRTFTVHTGPGPTAKLQGIPAATEFNEDAPVVASAMLNLATMEGLRFSDVKLVDVQTGHNPSMDCPCLTVTLEAAGRRYVWTGPETGPLELLGQPAGPKDG
ncbi:MAG: hypothetical protein OXG36_08010 [Caldilineaceae bacterium]|nr:hypothetical protein [Caldilineaceae bacterium]